MTTESARSERNVWLELVAAVDYLGATHRLGMTVCDAIEESIRRWTSARRDGDSGDRSAVPTVPWDDPDPLRSGIEELLSVAEPVGTAGGASVDDVLVAALDAWLREMANHHNEGCPFATPFGI